LINVGLKNYKASKYENYEGNNLDSGSFSVMEYLNLALVFVDASVIVLRVAVLGAH
jgi:hypothetical protein